MFAWRYLGAPVKASPACREPKEAGRRNKRQLEVSLCVPTDTKEMNLASHAEEKPLPVA